MLSFVYIFVTCSQVEPRLSAQMKAVSAEYLGPILDPITKSLASLSEIHENGLLLRELYSRDLVSRTISLPVRGHTLWVSPVHSSRGPMLRLCIGIWILKNKMFCVSAQGSPEGQTHLHWRGGSRMTEDSHTGNFITWNLPRSEWSPHLNI